MTRRELPQSTDSLPTVAATHPAGVGPRQVAVPLDRVLPSEFLFLVHVRKFCVVAATIRSNDNVVHPSSVRGRVHRAFVERAVVLSALDIARSGDCRHHTLELGLGELTSRSRARPPRLLEDCPSGPE